MSNDVYKRLKEFLNTLPTGFPATHTKVEIRMLKKLFTPEEAELTMKLKNEPEEVPLIAARIGMEESELATKLEEMVLKGLIYSVRDEGRTLYQAWQFIIGIFEYQLKNLDKDFCEMFDDGHLSVIHRKEDMIVIAGGYSIYSKEIDEVLFSHPKILEACTIGIPNAYRGETVKAFVVAKPRETLTEAEIIDYCKERLAAHKVPKRVVFLDALPKSAVGKILRWELQALDAKNQEDKTCISVT